MHSKWQLPSTPYSTGNLFDPCWILVETRRKVLPPASRRGDSRYSTPVRYQSFRSSDSQPFQPCFQRPFSSRPLQESQVRQGTRFPPKHFPCRGGGVIPIEDPVNPPPLPWVVACPFFLFNGNPLQRISGSCAPFPLALP